MTHLRDSRSFMSLNSNPSAYLILSFHMCNSGKEATLCVPYGVIIDLVRWKEPTHLNILHYAIFLHISFQLSLTISTISFQNYASQLQTRISSKCRHSTIHSWTTPPDSFQNFKSYTEMVNSMRTGVSVFFYLLRPQIPRNCSINTYWINE